MRAFARAIALALAIVGPAVAQERPSTPAATLHWLTSAVCLPFVIDGVDETTVTALQHIRRRVELPNPFSSPDPGRGYMIAAAGGPRLRLANDNLGRACMVHIRDGDRDALLKALDEALAARPRLFPPAAAAAHVGVRSCGPQGSTISVLVSSRGSEGLDVEIVKGTRRLRLCEADEPGSVGH